MKYWNICYNKSNHKKGESNSVRDRLREHIRHKAMIFIFNNAYSCQFDYKFLQFRKWSFIRIISVFRNRPLQPIPETFELVDALKKLFPLSLRGAEFA